jgi:uncharacterized protein with HEPN domain
MSKRLPLLYVQDILESIDAIFDYVRGMSFEEFSVDRMRCAAVTRELEIIGEAVGKLPATLKEQFPEVEWQDIKDFRNLLIHEYFGIDIEIVWKVVHEDLPGLKDTMLRIEKA